MAAGERLRSLALILLLATPALASFLPGAAASRTDVATADTLFTDVASALGVTADPAHGLLWFATEGGLVRTTPDLATRTVYTTYHGLPATLVVATRVLGDDLWIATAGGLARLHVPTGAITTHTMPTGALNDFILGLDVTPTALWVASDGGLLHYRLPDLQGKAYNASNSGLLGNRVLAVAVDGASVWAGTSAGLSRLDTTTGQWTRWARDERGFPDGVVRAILPTAKEILVATSDGAVAVPRNGSTPIPVPLEESGITTREVFSVARIGSDTWWGTRDGIAIHRAAEDRWLRTGPRDGMSGPVVTGITPWNATHVALATRGGLDVLDVPRAHYLGLRTGNGPYSNVILAGIHDGRRLWWGTGAGALRLDPATGRYDHLTRASGLAGDWVYGVYADAERWWFATTGGITWVWRANGTYGFQSINARALGGETTRAIDGDAHEVWVGHAFFGVVRYNRSTGGWQGYDVESGYPGNLRTNALLVEPDAVWVGAEQGAVRFDRRTETWLPLTDPTIAQAEVTAFARDDQRVYIATAAHGIVVWDRATDQFETWNATKGQLLHDGVRTLARDGGDLWVGHIAAGAARLDLASGEWTRFGTAHGLLADYATTFTFTPEIVYIGTLAGIARLDRATDTFLPTQLGPGALDAAGAAAPLPPPDPPAPTDPGTPGEPAEPRFAPTAWIDAPAVGERLAVPFVVTGGASVTGGDVETVYVRVDGGALRKAEGTRNWSFTLDAGSLAPGPHRLTVQAVAGGLTSASVEREFNVVEPGRVDPITVKHTPPPRGNAFAPTPLAFTLSRTPEAAELHYRFGEAGTYAPLPLGAARHLNTAIPPPPTAGTLDYYLTVTSGGATHRHPAEGTYRVEIPAEPRGTLAATAPAPLQMTAGSPATLALELRNTGNVPLAPRLEIKGLPDGLTATLLTEGAPIPVGGTARLEWRLDPSPILAAGTPRPVVKALDATSGTALATLDVPLRVVTLGPTATADPVERQGETASGGIPGPSAGALLVAAAAVALLVGRRRN